MPSWAVNRIPAFDSDLTGLRKAHYRKNDREWADVEKLVRSLSDELALNPFAQVLVGGAVRAYTRPYPNGYAIERRLLTYAKFKMPGLTGSAKFGRVLFEIATSHQFLVLLAAYNHSTRGFGVDIPDAFAANRLDQGRLAFPDP